MIDKAIEESKKTFEHDLERIKSISKNEEEFEKFEPLPIPTNQQLFLIQPQSQSHSQDESSMFSLIEEDLSEEFLRQNREAIEQERKLNYVYDPLDTGLWNDYK